MDVFLTAEGWIGLATLTFLEIVLGIDNIIFISIVANKLPEKDRPVAWNIGLIACMVIRIGLILCITWIISFKEPIIDFWIFHLSGRDIILSLGGLFLLAKSVSEIHGKMDGEKHEEEKVVRATFLKVILQILIIDIVFSFDSILTAVGLTDKIAIMIAAIIISLIIMMIFANKIGQFISKYPTLEMLSLAFLILIGFMLLIDGLLHKEIPKGYIYFAVAFSLVVEMMNIQLRKRKTRKMAEAAEKIKLTNIHE